MAARRSAAASEQLLNFLRLACITLTSAESLLQQLLVEDLAATLKGVPELPPARVAEIFQRLKRPLLPPTVPERPPSKGGDSVQGFVALLLSDIVALVNRELKVLSERSVYPLSARPDHVLMRLRDAFSELSNALILVEDKMREADDANESVRSKLVREGSLDVVGYTISRVEHLRTMFPSAGSWVAFGVFTNGRSVRIFRVSMSEAPDGTVTPSVLATPLLPLLEGSGAVPEGFTALVRLLSASPAELCELAVPPADLSLSVAGAPLHVEDRLGTGGFTNVYATCFEGAAAVVKCALVGGRTPAARAGLAREASVLRALNDAGCPCVPRLLAVGDALSVTPGSGGGARPPRAAPSAPCLVLAPRGVPLCMFAVTLESDAARLALARRVARGALRALRGAHAAGFVHGDVRPSNLVLLADGDGDGDGDGVQLVDWGAAKPLGERGSSRWGTLPFVSDDVALCFSPPEPGLDQRPEDAAWEAAPATDLEPVAYLFAAVALCGAAACVPGWHDPLRATPRVSLPLPPPGGPADMVAARGAFLRDHAAQLGAPLFEFMRRVRAGETPYDFEF